MHLHAHKQTVRRSRAVYACGALRLVGRCTWHHSNVGGVTAGQAPHNSSTVGVVTAGQAPHNSSTVGVVTAGQVGHNSSGSNTERVTCRFEAVDRIEESDPQ